jgi:hypothetical protein
MYATILVAHLRVFDSPVTGERCEDQNWVPVYEWHSIAVYSMAYVFSQVFYALSSFNRRQTRQEAMNLITARSQNQLSLYCVIDGFATSHR